MITTEINPPWVDPARHLQFLRRGFRGQWDRRYFEWYFKRPFNGRQTDVAVRAENGNILATASYCYRQIVDSTGALIDVCVMGTAATLPHQRGRGHYAQLLNVGLDLCRERSCALMLGFATRANRSCRGFDRLGAESVPSYYLMSRTAPRRIPAPPARPLPEMTAANAVRMRPTKRFSEVTFAYSRPEDWSSQFLERAHRVRSIRLAHDSMAIVESVGDTDRLQFMHSPDRYAAAHLGRLVRASAAAGRRFFAFTTETGVASAARRLGLRVVPGALLVLGVGDNAALANEILRSRWRLHSGDRM